MGRTVMSTRLAVKDLANRWARVTKALREDERKYGEELQYLVQQHSAAGFAAFGDPLESAIYSVLVELLKERDEGRETS